MRISSRPINISAVTMTQDDKLLKFKSNKGEIDFVINDNVDLVQSESEIWFVPLLACQESKAMAGTTRALVNNIVVGLTTGFEKKLILKGVGYRAKLDGKKLVLNLGKSHQDFFEAPEGVTITVPSQTEIVVSGARKDQVSQVAANIRSFRKPEPYKGKGIRYENEKIIIKEVKK